MTPAPTVRRRCPSPSIGATRLLAAGTCAVTLLAVPLLGQDEPGPVTLRLDSREGASATYVYEQAVDLIMPPEFGGEQSIRSSMVLEQTTREITDEIIRLVTEVIDLSVEMNEIPYAGELDLSRIVGRRFDMAITRQGRLVDIGLTDDDAAAGQIKQSLRQVGFPILTAETTFIFEPADVTLAGLSVEMTGSRADAVRFDVTNGRFLASRGQQDFTMNMAVAGKAHCFAI